MSFLTIFLRMAIAISFTSAIHPFDQLREQNIYPVRTYEDRYFDSSNPIAHHPMAHLLGWGSDVTMIACSQDELVELAIPDCEAAINVIPTGHLILDPSTAHSLGTVEFQDSVKYHATLSRPLRKFRLPAAFRAGECVVYVRYKAQFEGLGTPLGAWPGPLGR
jgi:hypothetical protein